MSKYKMKTSKNRVPPWKRIRLAAALTLTSAFVISCGGGGSGDGGIIGTGIELRGTVPTNRAFAESTIEIKSQSGERSTAVIASNGQFSADDVQGSGPFLLRVNLGNGIFLYGISHAIDSATTTQNVHAYSDVVIRNWFATNGLDIDSTFDSAGPINALPSETEIAAINNDVNELVAPTLDAYGLGNVNLQNVAFTADNTGVDRFLDLNPVIVNNGTITIIVTDPDVSTASTVASNLPVGTDFSATDTQAPEAPSGVRALASASNEIVVAWESSSDNVAVVSYEVLRDGAVVAETPFPVFIDTGLQAGIVFDYVVVALDAAGNRSLVSSTASSSTLAAPDVTPPPSPTGVELVPDTASVNIRWTQGNIADVASFTLLRAEGAAMIDTLVRVTSTAFDDVGLNSGTQYCYQVIANDASENASPASDVVCTTTLGSSVTSPTTPTTPTPTPTTGLGLDHLTSVDVGGISCTLELTGSDVDGAVNLPAGCYEVPSSLTLGEGDLLTLSPGVILKFASGTRLTVNSGASLTANGTVANPIILSGLQQTPGFWQGVRYSFSNDLNNSFENVVLEFAGTGPGVDGALDLQANSTNISRFSANNLLLRNSASDGFSFDNGSILGSFSNVISTSNERVGRLTPELAGSIASSVEFTGNEIDAISLLNVNIGEATILPNLGVPWLADNIIVDAPLEIAAGNTLIFDSLGSVRVNESGSLRAIGTALAPITFTGSQMTPGFWEGLELAFTPSVNNVLDHVVVEYAGGGAGTSGALDATANTSFPSRLVVSNTILRNSTGAGFDFDIGTIVDGFSNVTSVGNDVSGVMHPDEVGNLGTGLLLQGNTRDFVELLNGDIDTAQTWPTLDVPYFFDRLTIDAAWSLSPGTTLVADNGADIRVNEDGSLNAVGTALAPISFIGEQALPGSWDGIEFAFSNQVLNVLDNVIVSDAGSGSAPSSAGNISLTCNGSFPAQVNIANSTVTNGAGFGVFTSTTGCSVNVGANVDLTGNTLGAFNLAP